MCSRMAFLLSLSLCAAFSCSFTLVLCEHVSISHNTNIHFCCLSSPAPGSSFVQPRETHHAPTRMFFANEVLRGSRETVALGSVRAKCAVLRVSEFGAFRPLNIPADDVWVCRSHYHDDIKTIAASDSLGLFRAPPALPRLEKLYLDAAPELTTVPSPLVAPNEPPLPLPVRACLCVCYLFYFYFFFCMLVSFHFVVVVVCPIKLRLSPHFTRFSSRSATRCAAGPSSVPAHPVSIHGLRFRTARCHPGMQFNHTFTHQCGH